MSRALPLLLACLLGCGPAEVPENNAAGATGAQPTRASVEGAPPEVELPDETGSGVVAPPSVEVPSVAQDSVMPDDDVAADEVPEDSRRADDDVAAIEAPRRANADSPRYRVVATAVTEAEDGLGELVPVVDAVGVEFDAADFPAGGSDPVLHVGSLRFTRYRHPRIGVLRFELADRSVLGGPIVVAQGGVRTRVVPR